MKIKLFLALLSLMLMAACYPLCEQASVDAVVVSKQYHQSYTTYTQIPHRTCTKIGKSQSCTTWYTSMPVYHPESFEVSARYNDAIYWRAVTGEVYANIKEGDPIQITVCKEDGNK